MPIHSRSRLRSILYLVPLCLAVSSMATLSAAAPIENADEKSTSSVAALGSDESLLAGIPGEGDLTLVDVELWLSKPENHVELTVQLPKGLDAAKGNLHIPADNPLTRAKIELGRQLFFDKRLSSDNTISCASCHDPAQAYGAQTQFGIGVRGQQGGRNSPVAYNRIVSKAQFWDGRAASLEEQAVGPIANPIEMANTHEKCVADLKANPVYTIQFNKVFSDGVNIDNVGKAIAAFERTLVTGPAPYDYQNDLNAFEKVFADDLEYLDEEPALKKKYDAIKANIAANPMSESAKRGMILFAGKAKCTACHVGANFADEQYHNLGVAMDVKEPDLGRYVVTKVEKDKGAFKTPTLRNIVLSPPYMHDGSQKTLDEIVEWYDKGGHKNQWLSDKMTPLKLTVQEKSDLVAFMEEGLTGSFPKIQTVRLPQ